jgi:hypothetical protein
MQELFTVLPRSFEWESILHQYRLATAQDGQSIPGVWFYAVHWFEGFHYVFHLISSREIEEAV